MTIPCRCWFQLKLSTWFVLVAILAWELSTDPVIVWVSTSTVVYKANGDPDYLNIEDYLLPNPAYLYPVLALAAFVGWKAVWLIADRRRERATPQS
jgi:hypothetical protein